MINHGINNRLLEIKSCGLGSRIRDMEAESHNWSHFLNLTDLDFFFKFEEFLSIEMVEDLSQPRLGNLLYTN